MTATAASTAPILDDAAVVRMQLSEDVRLEDGHVVGLGAFRFTPAAAHRMAAVLSWAADGQGTSAAR